MAGYEGAPGWQRTKLAVDATNNTITPTDVAGLGFEMLPSFDYEFEFLIPFQSALLTTGFGLSLSGPGSPVLLVAEIRVPISLGIEIIRNTNAYGVEALGTGIDAVNAPRVAKIKGLVRNGTTAGTLTARFRSEVLLSAVTVKAGALVRWQSI
jgi:hypothetical protein